MQQAIAVLNAGSSSLKFSLFRLSGTDLALDLRGQIEGINTAPRFAAKNASGETIAERTFDDVRLTHVQATEFLVAFLDERLSGATLAAVGHRVVHGGTAYDRPVRVDAGILAELEALVPLAPLHQPHNLAPIHAIADETPALPQIACFDTAFHRSMPPVAQAFALPPEYTERGIRRYGFHGLSYEYIAVALPAIDNRAARGRTVVAHLGNGASMCAMRDGASVASSMGFTAVEGLMMGTRCGSIDPGVILHLQKALGMDVAAVEKLIYHQSGLLGVSGVSSDMRTLLASDDPRAAFAVELFCYRVARELGSLAAAAGGLDALVFTGGIGEHAAPVRARVIELSSWLGLDLDAAANAAHRTRLSAPDSDVPAYVIPTNEELMIARHAARVIGLLQ